MIADRGDRGERRTWVGEAGFARRPAVVVEDHLHHVSELLAALAPAGAALLGQVTVVCLDRPGPDTDRAVERWLADFAALQVAASWDGGEPVPDRARFLPLDPAVFADAHRYGRAVAGLVRPGGLLIQDVQLSTLRFLPADRWWESIFLASTVRGMFPQSPPACRFLSNKRGYQATFGRDLLDAGFDPRDVLDKSELEAVVLPVVRSYLERAFPLALRMAEGGVLLPDVAVSRGKRTAGRSSASWTWCSGTASQRWSWGEGSWPRKAGGSPSSRGATRPPPGPPWWRTASAVGKACRSWRWGSAWRPRGRGAPR